MSTDRSRPRLRLAFVLVRSSAVLPLTPGIIALLILYTVMRGHPWDHEWGWAIYQAGFVTVFLGPLCAGIGVWDGTQLAKSRPTIESSGRPGAARGATWAAIVGVVATTYLVLLAVLGVALVLGGILDRPTLVDLSPIPGVLALCGAWSAIGVAVGYRWPAPLLAPIATAGAFAATLMAYLAQPFLVQVGGATASILFLKPRPAVQLGQLTFFAAIAASALVGLRAQPGGREPLLRRMVHGIGPLVAVAATVVLVTLPGTEFLDQDRLLVCEGDRPTICVTPAYRDRIDWPRRYLAPPIESLDRMGIAAPTTFSQAIDRPAGQGSIPDELLRGHPPEAGPSGSTGPGGLAVLGAYLANSCDIFAQPELQAAYELADRWLASLTTPEVLDDPTAPAILRTADGDAKAGALQHAFATLAACSS